MTRRLLALVCVTFYFGCHAVPAIASDPTPGVTMDDDTDMVQIMATGKTTSTPKPLPVSKPTASAAADIGPSIEWRNPTPHCGLGGAALCSEYVRCADGAYEIRYEVYVDGAYAGFTWHCEGDELPAGAPTPPPGPTLEQIFAAAKNIPVPAATISIQPPGGETLVNLPTVVSTEAREFTFEADVEDVVIVYTATPTTFTWSFGDGTPPLTTTTPGKPWTKGADLDTLLTHTYANAAKSRPISLSVAWTATYTKPNGESGPVPGVINKASGPVSLRVLEAEPVLTE